MLTEEVLKFMLENSNIILYGKKDTKNRAGIVSFNIKGKEYREVAKILSKENIAIRAGHHCTMPLMKILNTKGTARVSFYIYNTKEEVSKLIEMLFKISIA